MVVGAKGTWAALPEAVDPLIIPSGGYERVIEAEQQACS